LEISNISLSKINYIFSFTSLKEIIEIEQAASNHEMLHTYTC
jgi:hypothetical protein